MGAAPSQCPDGICSQTELPAVQAKGSSRSAADPPQAGEETKVAESGRRPSGAAS